MSRSSARSAAWLGLALLPLLLACGGAGKAPGAPSIRADELARRLKEGAAPLILDVRTPEEYAAGHIPGAVLIPYDQLETRLGELHVAPSDEIVVHCKSGRRAEIAEQTLAAAGYTGMRSLEGHWVGWEQGGFPVEK